MKKSVPCCYEYNWSKSEIITLKQIFLSLTGTLIFTHSSVMGETIIWWWFIIHLCTTYFTANVITVKPLHLLKVKQNDFPDFIALSLLELSIITWAAVDFNAPKLAESSFNENLDLELNMDLVFGWLLSGSEFYELSVTVIPISTQRLKWRRD